MGEIIPRPKPPIPLPFTGERLTSEYGGQTQIEHLHRYLLAREWCRGKDVLDVASGEGYGTAMLAQVANSAVGVELAPDAVEHANTAYAAQNLGFMVGDARALPNPDAAFDVVVSFETIEHFSGQTAFLNEVRRVLRPGGLFIVSTPDRDNYSPAETPANPYHVQEMTRAEFETLLEDHFSTASILLQRPVYGSVLMPTTMDSPLPICFERRGDQHFEASAGLARPQYLVGFASDGPAAALPPSVYIDTGRLGMLSPPEAEAHLNAVFAEKRHLDVALSQVSAAAQDAQAQIEAYATAAHNNAVELEALRTQAASLQGETKGLLIANEMAERACAATREELVRRTADGASALNRAQAAAEIRLAAVAAELAATQNRAVQAEATIIQKEAVIKSMFDSTSWRMSAPLRMASRLLRRRS